MHYFDLSTGASGAVMMVADGGDHVRFTEMAGNPIGQLIPGGDALYLPLALRNR